MNNTELIMEKDGWFGVDDILHIVKKDENPRFARQLADHLLKNMCKNKMLHKNGSKYRVNNMPVISKNSFEDKLIHDMCGKEFTIKNIKDNGKGTNWRYKKVQWLVKNNILLRTGGNRPRHKYMVPRDVFSRFRYK